MTGGSRVCLSKVSPPANERRETQSDSHPSPAQAPVMWCCISQPPLRPDTFWQGFGDDDECNVLIRSILFEDVDSVEV